MGMIYTLTLSPAYDLHARCEGFTSGRENLCEHISRECGGKGINISRALHSAGIESTAVILAGKDNSDEFEKEISASLPDARFIFTSGRIRENLTIHHGAQETRISYRGFDAPKNLIELIKDTVSPAPCDVLTVTGRLPEGMSPCDMLPYINELREKGVKIVIDSRSYGAKDIKSASPWLIKPNREEISAYLGKEIRTLSDIEGCYDGIIALGAEAALITLDSEGAALVTPSGVIFSHAPVLNAISTIGAGDSTVAGFIWAHTLNEHGEDALMRAIACGSAAVLTKGTLPPRKSDIEKLLKIIKTNK